MQQKPFGGLTALLQLCQREPLGSRGEEIKEENSIKGKQK